MSDPKIKYQKRESCTICKNTNLQKKLDICDFDSHLGDFDLLFCPECGMYYTSPYPIEETIENLYLNKKTWNFDMGNSVFFESIKCFFLKLKLKNLKSDSFADFGTGNGRLVCILRDINPSSKIVAVDFTTERPVALNNTKYADIEYITTENFFNESTLYDTVFLRHVLEHTHDPVAFLERIYSKLNINGKLIIEVPNVESGITGLFKKYSSAYYPPYHIVHFAESSLKRILDDFGYDYSISKMEMPIMSNILANLSGQPINDFFRCMGVLFHPLQLLINKITDSAFGLEVVIHKHKY